MDSYTITIAPNDDSGNSTTLVVDTSGGQVRITDVHLHATDGLSGGTMPTVDFGLLLRAVGPAPSGKPPIDAAPADVAVHAEATPPSPPDAGTPASVGVEEPPPAKAPRSTRATRSPAATPASEPRQSRPRRARATAAETTDGTRRGDNAAPPTKKAPGRKTAVKKAATPAAGSGGRAYRRMPDDFPAVYQQTSSPAALADHYGVPRHTAQGWIRRIKSGS